MNKPKKIFVLDTNVLLHDPKCLEAFGEHDIVIPHICIQELDEKKAGQKQINANAREVSRYLDALPDILHGSPTEGGGTIKVKMFIEQDEIPETFPLSIRANMAKPDNIILATAFVLHKKEIENSKKGRVGKRVVLVSKDTNVRLLGKAFNIETEDYLKDKVFKDIFTGIETIHVGQNVLDIFFEQKSIPMEMLDVDRNELFPNQFIELKANASGYGIFSGNQIKGLIPCPRSLPIHPKNPQQKMAVHALIEKNFKLVSLLGKAGTGKTLLALAAAIYGYKEKYYQSIHVSRPIVPMGHDLGYLPGKISRKLAPWTQPIYDNLAFILQKNKMPSEGEWKDQGDLNEIAAMEAKGILNVEPITYIKGRSMPEIFYIIDEAQNLTPREIKTIITRAGDNTKIVLTGDIEQIDHPYLDQRSNGLSYVINKFADQDISAHITLTKTERSELAEIAANIL